MSRFFFWRSLALLAISTPLGAQAPDSSRHTRSASVRVSLTGLVTDTSNVPLSGASVGLLDSTGHIARNFLTGIDGLFELHDLAEGQVAFFVRKLGFMPRTIVLNVDERADRAFIPVVLAPASSTLDTVVVTATMKPRGRLAAFVERRSSGFGHFLDSTDIARFSSSRTSELLGRVAGVKVIYRPPRRGSTRASNYVVRMRGESMGDCAPALWLDGARVTGEVDEMTHPDDIAAIEVYTSAAQMPAQFLGSNSGCGAIVIWLK